MFNIYENSRSLKKLKLTNTQLNLINQINYVKKDQTWWVGKIQEYLKNNYPLDILVKNQQEIRNLGRDSSSLKSYIIRFGDKLGSELFKKKTAASTITKEKLIKKLGEKEYVEFLRRRGASLENFINRHGSEQGNILWNQYLKKRADSYRKKRENGHIYPKYNLEYFIKLHGEEKGKKIYFSKINSQRYKVSKKYYIEQYGEILGPILCQNNKDHCSLSFFCKKYGNEEGSRKYAEHCIKISKLTSKSNRYSNISKQLFDEIKKTIIDLFYYGENELTWATAGLLAEKQRAICPDLFYKGKIIEFNGDLFHANPTEFKADDTPHPFNKKITAKEIWDLDKLRVEYYINKGYKILQVWESDYKQNKEEVIKKCLQFLMN